MRAAAGTKGAVAWKNIFVRSQIFFSLFSILPSGGVCPGGAGVVDLDVLVRAGTRVPEQLRAHRHRARVPIVTSETRKYLVARKNI